MSHDNEMIKSEGRTVEEAVSEALLQLGARKEEVEITVLEEGKSGLFGVLGRKAACVEVRLKPRKRSRRRGGRGRRRGGEGEQDQRNAAPQNEGRQGREGQGGRGGQGRDQQGRGRQDRDQQGRGRQDQDQQGRGRQDRDQQGRGRQDQDQQVRGRQDQGAQEEPRRERPVAARQDGDARPTREPRQRRERPPRGREDRPREDRPREDRPREDVAAKPAAEQAPRPEVDGNTRPHREPRERRPRSRDQQRERPPMNEENANMQEDQQRPAAPRPEERPAAAVLSGDPLAALELAKVLPAIEGADIDETIAKTAEDLLRRCGIFSRAKVTEGEDGYRNVRMVTDANSADIMAGRRNSVISSVQHLCDRIASRASGDHVKVDVDINNYRQRRDGGLAQMAENAMKHVKETGEEAHLDPMNARERRIVHMEVAEVDGVDTTTVGEGPDRHVVIIVAKDDAAAPAAPEESSDQ